MALHRFMPVALLALAACAPRQADIAARPLIPRNGPDASVRVDYEGGVLRRRIEAVFTVERPSYVMVGHLGGDGIIRVLFPEDPRESGWIRGGRHYRTAPAAGDYDAAPGLWFMRQTFRRTAGARHDSYDGNGHGYVFVIASDTPLRFDRISDASLWDEFELQGYETALDPRSLVRTYADRVSPGGRYTLSYATRNSSFASSNDASQRAECALQALQLSATPWLVSAVGFTGIHGLAWGCRNSLDWGAQDYYRRRQIARAGGLPWIPIPVTPGSTPSDASPMPIKPRSGRRNPLGPGRSASTSSHRPIGGRTITETGRGGEEVLPAPRTPRRDVVERSGFSSPGNRDDARHASEGRRSSQSSGDGASASGGSSGSASTASSAPAPQASSGGTKPRAPDARKRDP